MPRYFNKNALCFCGILLIAIGGCKKEDGQNGDGRPPVLLVNGTDVHEDTLKLSAGQVLELAYAIDDDQNSHSLSMSKLQGAIVKAGDFVLNNARLENPPKSGSLTLQALEVGTHSFMLTVENPFGASGTALVEVLAIDNYEPVAALGAEQLDEAAPYHVRFNAAESFDRDAAWGGGIIAYEFNLEGFYTVETERAELDYIYPGPGNYAVQLRAEDTDGAWSEAVRIQIEVE